jgi:surface polysaccharide O-acyltransferase-like enzyme
VNVRKHHLDWLRVIAFGLLILFHTGLLYVTWSYNLKSPRLAPGLEWVLSALSPWRMAMVFVISGVACRFLMAKLGPGRFAWDRFLRLQPVILFGMFVVIPPQTWIELVSKGVTDQGYLEFWFGSYLPADQTLVRPLGKTMPTWDHLWFLVYLFWYAMGFAAVCGLARGRAGEGMLGRIPLAVLLIAPALWLGAADVNIDLFAPPTWNWDDWGAHLKWIGMFVAGLLIAPRDDVWRFVRERRGALAVASAVLLTANLICRAWGLEAGPLATGSIAYWVTAGLYGWIMILTVFGYASRYLDRPSRALSYLNEAILPVYVLHQPILLLSAYVLFQLRWPLPLEAAALVAVTLGGSLLIQHLLIRPFGVMRFLFGLRPRARPAPRPVPPRLAPADDIA